MQHAFVARGQVDPQGRRRGAPVPHLDGNRFIAFAQNHDHVGNRAAGDRLIHQAGVEKAMIAAALVAFSPFTLLLFQGEEWGSSSPFCFFADFSDPAARRSGTPRTSRGVPGFEWTDDVPDRIYAGDVRAIAVDWDELGPRAAPACARAGIVTCSR